MDSEETAGTTRAMHPGSGRRYVNQASKEKHMRGGAMCIFWHSAAATPFASQQPRLPSTGRALKELFPGGIGLEG